MLLLLSMARCYYHYPWRNVIHGAMLLSLTGAWLRRGGGGGKGYGVFKHKV